MLEGNRSEDVAEAIKANYPGVDPGQLIQKAGDHFSAVARADASVIRGWCLEAFRETYRKMVDIGDFANALKAIKELMNYAKQCSEPPQDQTDDSPSDEPHEVKPSASGSAGRPTER